MSQTLDALQLTKPKVVVLMLITSLVGMFLATRAGVPWTLRALWFCLRDRPPH